MNDDEIEDIMDQMRYHHVGSTNPDAPKELKRLKTKHPEIWKKYYRKYVVHYVLNIKRKITIIPKK